MAITLNGSGLFVIDFPIRTGPVYTREEKPMCSCCDDGPLLGLCAMRVCVRGPLAIATPLTVQLRIMVSLRTLPDNPNITLSNKSSYAVIEFVCSTSQTKRCASNELFREKCILLRRRKAGTMHIWRFIRRAILRRNPPVLCYIQFVNLSGMTMNRKMKRYDETFKSACICCHPP
ncbi:hypothetical protein L5515_017263 [Caenorhabditis briggsae]|uniref:Uncharacterized protein n=1 Tax=Caenorhabditis briggsae TaxID=6238 RepID=A0AAE9FJ37_CAEBR|nr:hypothetical protein L5515_017263 [Caenorhabditis briggsae]